MSIEGIDRITYGVDDLEGCKRFFLDWGLKLVRGDETGLDFESLNGCEVMVRKSDDAALPPAVEAGPTLREVIWGVSSEADLAALGSVPKVDPTGIGLGFRISRKRPVTVEGTPANVWGHAARIDTPSPVYDRAEPVEVGHVVFFTDKLAEMTIFYEKLGFRPVGVLRRYERATGGEWRDALFMELLATSMLLDNFARAVSRVVVGSPAGSRLCEYCDKVASARV